MKVVRSIDNETSSPAYPAIVVSLGSGVSIIKVRLERVCPLDLCVGEHLQTVASSGRLRHCAFRFIVSRQRSAPANQRIFCT